MLLLEDGYGDGELGSDHPKPFNILIKHIREFIGLINSWCANLEVNDLLEKGTTMNADTKHSIKAMLQSGQFITAPGVFDLVSAKIADRTSAEAIYMTGY